uniref:CRAL-TRIO domain-containing protein n=1 Tax=Compsopogon caeruleus TaxID=31354 RepID=A0A7S1TDE7_9RHOD
MDEPEVVNENSVDHEATLEKLRARVESELVKDYPEDRGWLDDACLNRYLRARKFDWTKAFAMLEATLRWRREFGVVKIITDVSDGLRKEGEAPKTYVNGKDMEGRPIMYMKPRFQNTEESEFQMHHLVYNLERAISEMEPPVEKMVIVMDFKQLSRRNNPSLSTQKQTLNILQNHYPERLGMAILVDAPPLFHALYKVIRPFVDPVTRSKIAWMKSSPSTSSTNIQHQNILTEIASSDQVESEYGGSSNFFYDGEAYFAAPLVLRYLTNAESKN